MVDDVGMRAIPVSEARAYFDERAEWKARQAEDARRRLEEQERKKGPVPAGVPAQEGMTPLESIAAAGGLVSPRDEFGGIPAPNFLEEELAAGRRVAAEKERAVAKMKEDLR